MLTGNKIIELASVSSTNDYANFLCEDQEVKEGTLVWTLEQSNGKGQRGNRWESEPGLGLCFSIVFYPHFLPLERINLLGVFSALSIRNYLTQSFPSLDFKIKWPNDLMILNKKVGGILIENSIQGNKIHRAIVGVGININHGNFIPTLPDAISIKQITGRSSELRDLINPVLFQSFDKNYELLSLGRYNELLGKLNENLWGKGQLKSFTGKNGSFTSIPNQINPDGSLNITEKDNSIRNIFWPENKMLIGS